MMWDYAAGRATSSSSEYVISHCLITMWLYYLSLSYCCVASRAARFGTPPPTLPLPRTTTNSPPPRTTPSMPSRLLLRGRAGQWLIDRQAVLTSSPPLFSSCEACFRPSVRTHPSPLCTTRATRACRPAEIWPRYSRDTAEVHPSEPAKVGLGIGLGLGIGIGLGPPRPACQSMLHQMMINLGQSRESSASPASLDQGCRATAHSHGDTHTATLGRDRAAKARLLALLARDQLCGGRLRLGPRHAGSTQPFDALPERGGIR